MNSAATRESLRIDAGDRLAEVVLVPPAAEADAELETGTEVGDHAPDADSATVAPEGEAPEGDAPEADGPEADGPGPASFSQP